MSVARKDAFIKWYLSERSKSTFQSGSRPTLSDLRQNALKFGYEIRTVTIDGVEMVKIRWNEKAQFDFIDDFITNHQAKLWSSYLDLGKRLSICGVSAEKKHDDNIYQSEPYLTLQRNYRETQRRNEELAQIIEDFGNYLARTRKINWGILTKYNAELSAKWKSEFSGRGQDRK